MTEPVIAAYQRIKHNNGKKVKKKISKKEAGKILLYKSAGIFISMAMPYGNFAPLGLAFLSMERRLGRGAGITLLMTMIGSLFLGSKILSAKYIAAELIYAAVLFVLEKGVRISMPAALGTALVSLFLSGMMVLYWQGITAFSVSMLALELLVTAAGVIIMDIFKNIKFSRQNALNNLNNEERLALFAVLGMLLIGFKNIYIGNVISVMNIIAALLILIAGISTNAPVAASCGVIIGLLCGIETDYFLPMIGAFGFCGFLTGLFSKFGKGGSAAGLILANAVLVVYTNNAIEPMLKIYEIFAAAAAFIFIPSKLINDLRVTFELNSVNKDTLIRMKDSIKMRLRAVSESFGAMSETLQKLSDRTNNADVSDISMMFDCIADKICKKCRKSAVCWGKNFNSTYRGLFSLLEILERNGEIDFESVENHLSDSCLNKNMLLSELTKQYDILSVRRIWKNRVNENRELTGQQLLGVSRIMDDIACELDKKSFYVPSSMNIRNSLENKGFKVKDINVSCDSHGKYKIEITIKSSFLKNYGQEKIKCIIDRICSKDMTLRVTGLEDGKYSRIFISETEKFMVEPGIAVASASGKSGDNYRFFKLGNGKYVIILSDGMGTGEIASRESKAIIELLNVMLSSGFDKKIAVKLINSIMVMKSDEQAFVTIDICIIDLYTGEIEFIKTGAEPSFIRHGDTVNVVKAASLPAGIVAEAEPEIFLERAYDGATIVMITDGVESRKTGSGWIKGYIEDNPDYARAEELAKNILNKAVSDSNGEISDDMTVISVRVLKKVS